jgi:hypothetical protein
LDRKLDPKLLSIAVQLTWQIASFFKAAFVMAAFFLS